jgi:hypothetical protein
MPVQFEGGEKIEDRRKKERRRTGEWVLHERSAVEKTGTVRTHDNWCRTLRRQPQPFVALACPLLLQLQLFLLSREWLGTMRHGTKKQATAWRWCGLALLLSACQKSVRAMDWIMSFRVMPIQATIQGHGG